MNELKTMNKSKLSSISKNDLMDIIMMDDSVAVTGNNSGDDSTLKLLLEEIRELKKIQQETKNEVLSMREERKVVKAEIDELRKVVTEQGRILEQQQVFLEKMDSLNRAKKIVVTGVPEGTSDSGPFKDMDQDREKVYKVFETMGVKDGNITSTQRLGKAVPGRKRPILVCVDSQEARNNIVAIARNLKDAEEDFQNIRVKKDTHPAVRKEWGRLFQCEKDEKAKPENAGHEIRLDVKNRQLLRDNEVIDAWKAKFFF